MGEALALIVEEAARFILPLFRSGLTVTTKQDESPVTIADQQAEALIVARLAERFPDIPVIGEEHASDHGLPKDAAGRFFLVDPIDGTKAFVRGDSSFTVNIGLVQGDAPVAGAVCAPVTGEVWFTTAEGAGRRRLGEDGGEAIRVRPWPAEPVALVSHTLTEGGETWLREKYAYARAERMDSSIKFCRLAEGYADIYPRHGPTMEWDTAAADAVLRGAGGSVSTLDEGPLRYGKANVGFRNPSFVARGA
jgi:3'(2'), 5'-bisphosphate nucleotidase